MTTLLLNIDKTILHSYSLFYPLASLKPEDALDLAPHPPVLTADPGVTISPDSIVPTCPSYLLWHKKRHRRILLACFDLE